MSPTRDEQSERFEKTRITDMVYELVKEPHPDVEVVLFHGLQLDQSARTCADAYWRTWKMRNDEDCWLETLLPKLLLKDQVQLKARVLSVSYEARADFSRVREGKEITDEYILAESLVRELVLSTGELGQKAGVPVVLVGHDLGGILIKELVMTVEKMEALRIEDWDKKKLGMFSKNLKLVFFYAVPQSGSKVIEETIAKIPENSRHKMLPLMKVLNKETARINQSFQQYRQCPDSHRPKFQVAAVLPASETSQGGYNGQVIPEASIRPGVDSLLTVKADHFQVCQPEAYHSSSAQFLADKIHEAVGSKDSYGRNRTLSASEHEKGKQQSRNELQAQYNSTISQASSRQ